MLYFKNTDIDFIPVDESSLVAFDSTSESTYFFDEVGIDILNRLNEPRCIENIVNELCLIYNAPKTEIYRDVEEFLSFCCEKRIVICNEN